MNQPKYLVTISSDTIFKVLLVAFLLVFIYLIKEVLAIVFVAMLFSAALDPMVRFLVAKGLPRALAVSLIYVFLALIITLVVFLLVPPLTSEIKLISTNWPTYSQQLRNWFGNMLTAIGLDDSQDFSQIFQDSGWGFGRVVTSVFDFLRSGLSILLILVITFYFAVSDGLRGLVSSVTPVKYLPYVTNVVVRIQNRLGQWLRGQFILSFIIFGIAAIGLTLLNVPYALVLALVAGILEAIPFIGPSIAGALAMVFALTVSPLTALFVFVFFIVMQQVENHLLVPQVMGKSVGLNPLVILIAVLIGGKLAGLAGVLLAVPVTSTLAVFFGDVFEFRYADDNKLEI